jgi:hypothetical protein
MGGAALDQGSKCARDDDEAARYPPRIDDVN